MATSLLARTAGACSASVIRARPLALAARVQNGFARRASMAAKPYLEEDAEDASPLDALADDFAPPVAPPKPKARENPNGGNPEFASLKGKVTKDTLDAITGKPLGSLTHMTAVQAAVLPLLPELAEPRVAAPTDGSAPAPRDLLVKAKTGTGKTLGFLVPAVEARLKAIEAAAKQAVADAGLESDRNLENRVRRVFTRSEVGTLIISPTRELATQIANEAIKLTHFHKDFEVRLFVGGVSKRQQMRDWMKGRRDIVVATPGRLRDLLQSEPEVRKGIEKTRQLILDEADTLLDMGFRDDIDDIIKYLPQTPERQTFLFSATVSRAVQQVARATLSKDHAFINCVSKDDSPVHAHVPQYNTVVPSAEHQIPHLLRLLAHDQLLQPGKSKVIVFLPTTKMTQLFATLLRELSAQVLPAGRNTTVYEIHSKRTQEARTNTSDRFRADKSGASILVTSDVSARGVDYPGVTRVVQVGIPAGTDQYIHRVGRTGRGGATNGRGDLVLLPWEVGFVTWQLTEVPMKPVTTEDLKAEVVELAAKHDSNPTAFFQGTNAVPVGEAKFDRSGRVANHIPKMYEAPCSAKLETINGRVAELLEQVDEEAVRETMTSMLGYYISKAPELRVQKSVIVQGCKDWTVGACGLPTPPYISDRFLQQIGFSDNRTKHFGRAWRPERERSPSGGGSGGQSWLGRGQQSTRDQGRERPPWMGMERKRDPADPRGDASEYRTPRFNRAF